MKSEKIRLSEEAKKHIELSLYDWIVDMHVMGVKNVSIIDYAIYVNYEADDNEAK